MASPIPTVSPVSNANQWLYFQLKGVNSPGILEPGAIKGFLRETGWDEKKGKGTQGATLTLTSAPPVKGTITITLITDQDFTNWDNFVANVLSISPAQQQTEGLAIYYPQFASIGLTSVVIKDYSGPEHVGRGKYHTTISMIEWVQPPSVSIVSTVAAQAPDNPAPDTVPVQDPRIAALQAQIAAVSGAGQSPGLGSNGPNQLTGG